MENELETKDRNKRVVELLTRKDELSTEIESCHTKLAELGNEGETIEAELATLLGMKRTNGDAEPESKRKCALCGNVGHIIKRNKTPDGRPTCKNFPEGKPQEGQ
jgi:hypothetical protein